MKKNIYGYLILLGVLFFVTQNGKAQKVSSFPEPIGENLKTNMNKSPLLVNINEDKGVLMYGATMKDSYNYLHYVKFYSKRPTVMDKIAQIDPEDEGWHIKRLRCGAYCNGAYYGYLVNVYTYVDEPESFVKVDFETGTVTRIAELEPTDPTWPTLYEMSYDYKRNVCWALGRNSVDVTSDIYKINLANGKYEKVAELDFYAWALAVNYDGEVYAIQGIPDAANENYIGTQLTKLDADNNFAATDRFELKKGKERIVPRYNTQTMEFDHNSNHVYWFGTDVNADQYEYDIDIKKRAVINSYMLYRDFVCAVYIPFQGADNRGAAGKVTNLKGVSPEDGSLKATLTWNNPTTTWKGDDLTQLHSINISRGNVDNVIATVSAANSMGAEMSWTDETPSKGIQTYYLTPYRVSGEKGLVDSIKVMVGPDVPGKVENVKITKENGNIRISWEKPLLSATDKNYDETTLRYSLKRLPDNKVVVDDLAATTYLDEDLGDYQLYSYEITSKNKDGIGLTAVSSSIKAGKALSIPFDEKFDTSLTTNRWTSIDENLDGNFFEWEGWDGCIYDIFNRFGIYMNPDKDADDYIVTPLLGLKAGNSYRVTVGIMLGHQDDRHAFEVVMGKDCTAEAMTTVLHKSDAIQGSISEERKEFIIKTPVLNEDGDYYMAVHCTSPSSSNGSFFAVNKFIVEEVFDNDLAAIEIQGPAALAVGTEATFNVKVENLGLKEQSNYKVQIVNTADNTVLGETSTVPTLAVNASSEIPVTITPMAEGELKVKGKVVLENDGKPSNDETSEMIYKVKPNGSVLWNVVCKGDKLSQTTIHPMCFYEIHSTDEFIYRADEINVENNGYINGIAFEYNSNDIQKETDEVNVKIYMGNVDKAEYQENGSIDQWTNKNKLTLVYDGKINVEVGENKLMEFLFNTPFYYDCKKNLLVQVWKEGLIAEQWPAIFQTYDENAGKFRILHYKGDNEFTFTDEKVFSLQEIPIAHLAISDNPISGINEMRTADGIIIYDCANKTISINGFNAQAIYVYDICGKVIFNQKLNVAQKDVTVNLPTGLYIVKVINEYGSSQSKAIVISHE